MSDILEDILMRAQKYLSAIPVLVIGSGYSAGYDIPGMGALKDHIAASITIPEGDEDYEKWLEFLATIDQYDLETSLQKVMLSDSLLEKVINVTWTLINNFDKRVYEQVVRNQVDFPIGRLLKHLFLTTTKRLDVITTNYDRILEYAIDSMKYVHYTGFGFGYLRFREDELVIYRGPHPVRTVNIWKVHGSLDWFKDKDNMMMALPPCDHVPDSLNPCIVTPGLTKYEEVTQEPFRSIISGADNALQSAQSYLCIGYGFNDKHIQPKLLERVTREHIPVIVLARTLTTAIKRNLLERSCKEYLLIEKANDNDSRVYSPKYPEGTILENVSLWKLSDFISSTIEVMEE